MKQSATTTSPHSLTFGLLTVFLIGLSFSIINPVLPFLVQPYVATSQQQAFYVTLLTSVYALCTFLTAPILGLISDRFGRRPLLLVSLLGSAVGYLFLGLSHSLWQLFLGRMIEGITAGSITAIFAYFADVVPPAQRTKYFGWIGALAGAGSVLGPTFGGLFANLLTPSAPLFLGAVVTTLNLSYGYFFMQESLAKEQRLAQIKLTQCLPFKQLMDLFSLPTVKNLLVAGFLLWIPNGAFQGILSQFSIDNFHWQPMFIGLVFSIIGFQDILAQGLVMPKLLTRRSDRQIAAYGMLAEIIAYVLIASSVWCRSAVLFILGMVIFGFGDSIFGPAFNGLLSKVVSNQEQGRVQGGSQSLQALARIIGPFAGGQLYIYLGHSMPAILSVCFILGALMILNGKITWLG